MSQMEFITILNRISHTVRIFMYSKTLPIMVKKSEIEHS